MIHSILPSFIFFVALLIVAVRLVRKGKINRLAAILLVIVPVIAATVFYLGWIAPQQQRETKLQHAQQQLAITPAWRIVKQQEPALYKQLSDALVALVRAGTPTQQAIGQLRPMLRDLLNQRIASADDKSLISYMQFSVRVMQTLRKKDPQLCFNFLFPQVNGGVNIAEVLSVEMQREDLEKTEFVLQKSTGPVKEIDLPAARRSLQGIVRALYRRWGSDLQKLSTPADMPVDHTKMCDMTLDLYRAVLALPSKQSANLLRMMLSANAG